MGPPKTTEFHRSHYSIVHTRLMKLTGLGQLLSQRDHDASEMSAFSCRMIFNMAMLIVTILTLLANIFYCTGDFYQETHYIMLIVSAISPISKMFYMVRHATRIRRCVLQSTSIQFLSYRRHDRRVLEVGATRAKWFTTSFSCLWLIVLVSWLLSPFVLDKCRIKVNALDFAVPATTTNYVYYNYRANVLNLIFPVDDQFYNEHFMAYYCIESLFTLCWGYGTMIFDILLLSVCVPITYQLRMINDSYRAFEFGCDRPNTTGKLAGEPEIVILLPLHL